MEHINLKTLWSSIEEVAECPICLEVVKPPVTLCVSGHGICTSCIRDSRNCPTCREPLSNTNPRILNDILQKIPKFCKYHDQGCKHLSFGDHETYCRFRKVKCIFLLGENSYCDWEGSAEDWLDHVYWGETPHLNPHYVDIISDNKLGLRDFTDIATRARFDDGYDDYNVFIFYFIKSQGNFCLYIKQFPLKTPKVTTYFILSLVNSSQEILYKYMIKATTMLTLERDVNIEENVYCIRVPIKEMERFIDEDGTLCFHYKKVIGPL